MTFYQVRPWNSNFLKESLEIAKLSQVVLGSIYVNFWMETVRRILKLGLKKIEEDLCGFKEILLRYFLSFH